MLKFNPDSKKTKNNIRTFKLKKLKYIGWVFNRKDNKKISKTHDELNNILVFNHNHFIFKELIQKTYSLKLIPSDITQCKAYQQDKIPKQFKISEEINHDGLTLKQRHDVLKEQYELNQLNQKELKEYISQNQKILLNQWLGCRRFVYNHVLNFKKQHWDEQKVDINKKDASKEITRLRGDDEYHWLSHPDRSLLTQANDDVFRAYQNFYSKRANFPQFKKKHKSRETFRIQLDKRHKNLQEAWQNGRVILPKLGEFKFRGSHPHKMPKMITVVKNRDGVYFIKFMIEMTKEELKKDRIYKNLNKNNHGLLNNKKYFMTGLDVGVRKRGILSTGKTIENHEITKQFEDKIRKENRELARKQQGGSNWQKQKNKLNKIHEKIKNIRKDLTHKASHKLISENQVIVIEGLDIKTMMKKDKFMNLSQTKTDEVDNENKSDDEFKNNNIQNSLTKTNKGKKKFRNKDLSKDIQDVSWGELFRQLHYKGQWYDTLIIVLDQYEPTSQICSSCAHKNTKLDSEEYWTCSNPECGTTHHRDYNAALNIRELGIKELIKLIEFNELSINQILPLGGWKVTHGENCVRSLLESFLEKDPRVNSLGEILNNETFEIDQNHDLLNHEILNQQSKVVGY